MRKKLSATKAAPPTKAPSISGSGSRFINVVRFDATAVLDTHYISGITTNPT
jgi:hypothetical protein